MEFSFGDAWFQAGRTPREQAGAVGEGGSVR
jgi:hypothetical protein